MEGGRGGWQGGRLGSPARFTREERETGAGRRPPVLLWDLLAPHPTLTLPSLYIIAPDWAEADFLREIKLRLRPLSGMISHKLPTQCSICPFLREPTKS